jgi:hypothetical protein
MLTLGSPTQRSLLETADWYCHLWPDQQIADGATTLLFLEGNHTMVAHIVRLSLEFTKAHLAIETSDSPDQG